jgi:catechol 2,3-dioxygenase-like lactoylglutathione lyase family enzyme
MKYDFDSVFYYVSDLERSVRFYRDVLGFTFRSRDAVARFDVDGVLFEVVPSDEKRLDPQKGNARFCLKVDNVEEALRELRVKGVPTGQPEAKSNGVLGSFFDPDGNELCLWQYGNSAQP